LECKSDQAENILSQILIDLNLLNQDEIPIEEIPNLLNNLISDEVRTYIKSLEKNSKPETAFSALREMHRLIAKTSSSHGRGRYDRKPKCTRDCLLYK
jgi:hypothetical protein